VLLKELFTETSRLPDIKGYMHFRVSAC
jgi:hypothetical protein